MLIDYIVKHVGIYFDGLNLTPQERDDVFKCPLITKALTERGSSVKSINKILYETFLRVLKANEIK